MIEKWIDKLADTWMGIDLGGFGQVYSPYMVGNAGYPSSIDPSDLANQVIALNIPGPLNPGDYGISAPKRAFYTGMTQFHLAPNGDMAHLQRILPWYGRIMSAAVANPTLDGTVELFWIANREDAITFANNISFGNETPHWAMSVRWNVKENYDSDYRGWLSS